MSKGRFSSSDTKAMVRDIRATLLGQRVANIYDLNDKTYLFKFAVPGKSEKILLLLESGVRFHTTKYARDKSDLPSPFAMKLRKHVRTKRLEDVKQLCNDRVVDLKFGSGDTANHIILELYANGNIILTDENYEILALLRSHQFEEDVAIKVNEIYPMAFATSMDSALSSKISIPLPSDEVPLEITEAAIPTIEKPLDDSIASDYSTMLNRDSSDFILWAQQKEDDSSAWLQTIPQGNKTGGNKKNKVKKMTMRQLLLSRDSGVSSYGPEILDHCLLLAGIKASVKVIDFLQDKEVTSIASNILTEMKTAESLLLSLDVPGQPGYILCKPTTDLSGTTSTETISTTLVTEGVVTDGLSAGPKPEVKEFIDFVPRMFKQHEGQPFIQYSSFDETVDEYYCKLEEQKLEKVAVTAEEAVKKKVNKVRGEQSSLIATLEKQQRKMEEGALLVELFADDVEKCMLVINSALGAGMSWTDIEEMVKVETAKGNPIASLVSRLRLERNFIVLKLYNLYDEESDESDDNEDNSKINKKKVNFIEVEVDLTMSAYANVSRMYGHKKVAQAKEIKTLQASQRALIAVEEQSEKALEAQKIKRNLQAVRKVHWFEKFNWFITSEGYLVLSGRDAQQNEALVKRYLRPGDVYVHAELQGASSCIVRCKVVQSSTSGQKDNFKPISPFALQEAGNMTVCRSGAWGNKVITSAWWVFGSQVSKTAPTGEFLPTGSFMIYGKKHFLPPMPLEMGFGVMFRLDDGSVLRHSGERKDKSSMCDETESVLSEAASRYGIDFDGLGLREQDTDDEGSEEEGGDGSADEEVLEVEGEGDTVKAVSLDPFKLDSIHEGEEEEREHKGGEGDRQGEGIRLREVGVILNDTPVVKSKLKKTDFVPEERVVRLTAKERRTLKKMKSKGIQPDVTVLTVPTDDGYSKNDDCGDEVDDDDNDDEVEMDEGAAEGEGPPPPAQPSKGSKSSKAFNELEGGGYANPKLKGKGQCQGGKSGPVTQAVPVRPLAGVPPSAVNKKKFVNKKKAKRYADQDDDEKELAMLALGHVHIGEKYGAEEEKLKKERDLKDRLKRQEKAGINIIKESWIQLLTLLVPAVRDVLVDMVASGCMKEGEIDGHEIKTLASFNDFHAFAIIDLFRDGDNLSKVGNKSGFLAGIMRRYSKDLADAVPVSVSGASDSGSSSKNNCNDSNSNNDNNDGNSGDNTDTQSSSSNNNKTSDSNSSVDAILDDEILIAESSERTSFGVENTTGESVLSRRDRKKIEQQEILDIMEEEGILDAEEGKQADEIDKLTAKPLPEDILLYAVPVCGPYSALRDFKYSVKLTPGTVKKGKAAKQAVEVFSRGKECNVAEKALMRALNDPEMVAIMIGDVKLSMPGLYSVQRAKKGKK